MKKALRWTGIVVGVFLVLLGGAVGYFWFSDIPHYDVAKVEANVEITPARIERGRKLVAMTCADCHMDPSTNQLTGRKMTEFPAMFGDIWSLNITNDPTHGLGKWSDGDLVRVFRTGIHPSGRLLLPFMTRPALSDEDLYSVIAYLRSDHEWVRANAKADTAMVPALMGKVLYTMAFAPEPMPKGAIAHPDTSNKLEYGRYLTANLGCVNCHSNTEKPEFFEIEKTENFLSGGSEMSDGRNIIITPNISSSKAHGIGKWSELQFVRAMRDGFKPDGKPLRPPMPRFNELSYEEMQAIFTYLLTTKPNETPRVEAEGEQASM